MYKSHFYIILFSIYASLIVLYHIFLCFLLGVVSKQFALVHHLKFCDCQQISDKDLWYPLSQHRGNLYLQPNFCRGAASSMCVKWILYSPIFQFYKSLVHKLFEGLDPNMTPPMLLSLLQPHNGLWYSLEIKDASGKEFRLFYKLLNPG